jgi:pyruvate carboxylase subunit B
MKRIRFMDTSFRDGFQSVFGARVKTADFLPALAAAAEAGIDNFEIGGGARFQSLYFYTQDDAFDMHRLCRQLVGPKVNLQTLSRGVNVVGLESYNREIIRLHATLFAQTGISTIRNFDALNDVRNLEPSGKAIKDAGMKHQICVTMMALPPGMKETYAHSAKFYADTLKQILESNVPFDSVCFKDASGTTPPSIVGETIRLARQMLDGAFPSRHIDIEFHTHCSAGISELCHMEAIRNGADQIDLAMAPLSGGSCHTDILTAWHMFKGTDYVLVNDRDEAIDYEKILKAEEKFKECLAHYFVPPEAKATEPLVILSPMPGGALTANTQMMRDAHCLDRYPEVIKAMREVVERGGFGTSVTPVSQFYFQQAFSNVMQGPWKKITDGYGKMVLGYFGKTPSPADPEIVKLAEAQLKLPPTTEPTADINDRTKPGKAAFAAKLGESGVPVTDENIFIVAMCGEKGIDFLKGNKPLMIRYNEPTKVPPMKTAPASTGPTAYTVTVNGKPYHVVVNEAGAAPAAVAASSTVTPPPPAAAKPQPPVASPEAPVAAPAASTKASAIKAPMPGTVFKVLVKVGDRVAPLQNVVIIEAMKMEIEIKSDRAGTVTAVAIAVGASVQTGQSLISIA